MTGPIIICSKKMRRRVEWTRIKQSNFQVFLNYTVRSQSTSDLNLHLNKAWLNLPTSSAQSLFHLNNSNLSLNVNRAAL